MLALHLPAVQKRVQDEMVRIKLMLEMQWAGGDNTSIESVLSKFIADTTVICS
jgi:hypothetical protein